MTALIVGYNRPWALRQSLGVVIRESSITRLYIAIDGPKNETDDGIVVEARRTALDIGAEHPSVQFLFSEKNVGCRKFMEKAITWFYSQEEYGIILEDDIVISRQFIEFASIYIKHPLVSIVSACSYPELVEEVRNREAFLTRIPSIWGWATTRELWEGYLAQKGELPTNIWLVWLELGRRLGLLKGLLFTLCYRMSEEGELDAWDYPFAYYLIRNNLMTIMPASRLAMNIGFGWDSTHNANAHNPTLPWDEKMLQRVAPIVDPKLSFAYERMQSLNTPFYPEFRMHALKGLANLTLKKIRLLTLWEKQRDRK